MKLEAYINWGILACIISISLNFFELKSILSKHNVSGLIINTVSVSSALSSFSILFVLISDKILKPDLISVTDNILLFKKLYGDKVFTVALTAENNYLEHNLRSRGSEKDIDREVRLDRVFDEIKTIQEMRKEKLIDRVIEVGWDSRDRLSEIVVNEVSQEIKSPIERENILKFGACPDNHL